MHGLIANQLRSYAVARQGREAWIEAVRKAGGVLPQSSPRLDRKYPDEAIAAVVVALADGAGVAVPALLEDFGAYLAAALLRIYSPLLRPEWRTLEVVENAEDHIHTAVRLGDPGAGPPYLASRRVSPTEVRVIYTSARRLCPLAEGIVRGLAEHFEERIAITQPECMLRGDPRCLISIRREGPSRGQSPRERSDPP